MHQPKSTEITEVMGLLTTEGTELLREVKGAGEGLRRRMEG